jgi:hypothetical protein
MAVIPAASVAFLTENMLYIVYAMQLAGVITAFRMEGFCAAVNIVGQSVWKDMANAIFG